MNQRDAICRSALWAAYGDALGFVTELADCETLKWRIGSKSIVALKPWRRRIGGRFGVEVELPAGCYSDDTQLRLATSRAIRGNGHFDVEAFAKVELPVWRAYALGAGKGTKAAATALTKPGVNWCTNFFDSRGSRYVDGGGNGAAMRIQPHVWSSPLDRRDSEVLRDIIRNAITTHGHPRGILGAAFHGMCLRTTLRNGKVTNESDWLSIIDNLRYVPRLLRSDDSLALLWLHQWENTNNVKLEDSFDVVIDELLADVELASRACMRPRSAQNFEECVSALGGFAASTRGSGTKTAVLASTLANMFYDAPDEAMSCAANLLGSDTDTIATMAGALLGAIARLDPPQRIADYEYVRSEAYRNADIGRRATTRGFDYPDLLYWNPPATELDTGMVQGSRWFVAGLGSATPISESFVAKGVKGCWRWFELSFGQSVLLKCREHASEFAQHQLPLHFEVMERSKEPPTNKREPASKKRGVHIADFTVAEALRAAAQSGFDPRVVGAMLLSLASHSNASEDALEFAKAIALAQTEKRKKS